MQLLAGSKSDLLLVADSGPGDTTDKGLIVPRFGKNPENHVAVSMSFDLFAELLLETKLHYQAWLSTGYALYGQTSGLSNTWQDNRHPQQAATGRSPAQSRNPAPASNPAPEAVPTNPSTPDPYHYSTEAFF